MVYQQMLFAQLTLPTNMYLRDMLPYVCQTICMISYVVCQTICNIICNIICSYIYIYLLKVFCQTLPQEKYAETPWPLDATCASTGFTKRHSASQRCAEASQSRPGVHLSPQLRIFDIYIEDVHNIV